MFRENAGGSLDQLLAAIADPTRRRILETLNAGEARITDIAAQFPISLNSVSKHIRFLERAQLVERRVAGREHILRFRPEPLQTAQQWIAAQQNFWESRLRAIDELLSAEEASAAKPANEEKQRD